MFALLNEFGFIQKRVTKIQPSVGDLPQGWHWVIDEGPLYDSATHDAVAVEPVTGLVVEYDITPKDLEVVKEVCRTRFNNLRDAHEAGGFPFRGKVLDSDQRSVQRISAIVQAAQIAAITGAEFTVEWTCADNSVITLDKEGVLDMARTLAIWGNALHVTCRSCKEQVDAATTVEEALAVTWPQ